MSTSDEPPRVVTRALIDTNVILAGAMRQDGPAGRLTRISDRVGFVISDYALRECRQVVERHAPNPLVAQGTLHALDVFCLTLRALQVPDAKLPPDTKLRDPRDGPLLGAALEYDCDTICTYNQRDFAGHGLKVLSPLGILKLVAEPEASLFVQCPVLGASGTLMMLGILHHETSMGEILVTSNGIRVFNNAEGYVAVEGSDVTKCTIERPLIGGEIIAFFFRYDHTGRFEASLWSPRDSRNWREAQHFDKAVLTSGRAIFAEPVTPRLVFNGNFGFFARVLGLSGIPGFVRDRRIPDAIRSMCLEAVAGSEDIRELLARAELVSTPEGDMYIGYPSR